ncbi:MAG: hypothetical protein QF814_05290 [Candidatus Marinimicrobia bacterium]|nr:hypothetical protein [Candidatus Neomarinimicrobiota bacterium]
MDEYKKYLYLLIPLCYLFFLWEMVFYGSDPIANDSIAHIPIAEWSKSVKEFPHWFPNLFSGMPSYGGYIYTPGDPTKTFLNMIFLNRGIKLWFYFSLSGIGFFILLRLLKISSISCLFGGIVSGITPYSFGLINAGHTNKIIAMSFIPWILASVIYGMNHKSLKSILMISVPTMFQLWSNHPQVVYYTWMMVVFLWLWNLISDLRLREFSLKNNGMQICIIIIGLLLSLIVVVDPYYHVYEFQKHSNRGAESVLDDTKETSSGTDWDYATQWSFHPKETISFLYPYLYGLQNYPTRDIKSAAYWVFMPFTQSTHYLGLIVILFAILGALLRKPDRFESYMWVLSGLVIFVGFGSYFPVLYKPLFLLAPFFSKFRIPSMIFILLAITIPYLAAIGLDKLITTEKKQIVRKKILWVFGGFIGLTIIFLIFGESILSFSSLSDNRFNPAILSQVKDIRKELFNKGIMLALVLSGVTFGLSWLLLKGELNKKIFSALIVLITIGDLWVVNNEFLFLKKPEKINLYFRETPLINYLKNDNSHFRIFPVDELNSNKYGYWGIQSIGGYRAVKLRHFQDLMDAGGFGRPQILNMLNVKYVLTEKKINSPLFSPVINYNGLYKNTAVLPRTWFVNNIDNVTDQKTSLQSVLSQSFDPKKAAVITNYSGPEIPESSTGTALIETLSENEIVITASTSAGGLLILSEIYYKPGWKCKIDGIPTDIFQTNHVLRSIFVPEGTHSIKFFYDKNSWEITRLISRISFLIILFSLIFISWKEWSNRD